MDMQFNNEYRFEKTLTLNDYTEDTLDRCIRLLWNWAKESAKLSEADIFLNFGIDTLILPSNLLGDRRYIRIRFGEKIDK